METKEAMVYYAVCNRNGPISVRLKATTLEDAVEEFESGDHETWTDDPRMDAEDDLDISGEEMSEDEFGAALEARDAVMVRDLDPIENAHAGTVAHLADGWCLWALED